MLILSIYFTFVRIISITVKNKTLMVFYIFPKYLPLVNIYRINIVTH